MIETRKFIAIVDCKALGRMYSGVLGKHMDYKTNWFTLNCSDYSPREIVVLFATRKDARKALQKYIRRLISSMPYVHKSDFRTRIFPVEQFEICD